MAFRLGELTPVIIRHLARVCDGKTLQALAALNKTFRHACEPTLFHDLVIRETTRTGSINLRYITDMYGNPRDFCKYVRYLHLFLDRLVPDRIVTYLDWVFRALRSIEDLVVLNLRINYSRDDQTGNHMARGWNTSIHMPSLPNLKVLGIYSAADVRFSVAFPRINVLLDHCPNIEMLKLDITCDRFYVSLTNSAILTQAMTYNIKCLHLTHRGTTGLKQWDKDQIYELFTMFPNVVALGLGGGIKFYRVEDLVNMLRPFENLEDLVLCDTPWACERRGPIYDRAHIATAIFENLPQIERLSLHCDRLKSALCFERVGHQILIANTYHGTTYQGHTHTGATLATKPLIRTFAEEEWMRVVVKYL